LSQGVAHVRQNLAPKYILLTDADIAHGPDSLRALVARAEAGGYGLVSLMALLRCESFAEKLLIPAFVYFFQMLYPFRWTRDPDRATAGAAGGCMLVRAESLDRAGGLESIKGALIDDCALGARLKAVGPVHLSLTRRVASIRPYPRVKNIGGMISRSAYAQLNFSPWRLAGARAGMASTYVLPVALALRAQGAAGVCGALAFGLMVASFMPINRFYGLGRAMALLLPLIAVIYMVYTLRSALDFHRGRGGMWKGRAQAPNRTMGKA
jgi:hopene-associated glycosyltransferase HpnB